MKITTIAMMCAAGLAACQESQTGADRGETPVATGDGKADGAAAIELASFVAPGAPVEGRLTTATPRVGHVLFAAAGASVTAEVTAAGVAGLDTVMTIYGPRAADGSYRTVVVSDDDGGADKLSRVAGEAIVATGFYLVEVTTKAPVTAATTFKLEVSCTGTCTRPGPVASAGLDVRWVERSAEYRAATIQAYALATRAIEEKAPFAQAAAAKAVKPWGVILDIDETTMSNATYQRERAELGTGYSSASWLAWVNRRAATPIPGVKGFLERVKALGGKIVLVTNRKDEGECEPTRDNLRAAGVPFDAVLCKTDTSDKNPRFDAVAAGSAVAGLPALDILLYCGDNILDFPELSQAVRTAPEADLADFGDRFVLIPNPMYGSWEQNP